MHPKEAGSTGVEFVVRRVSTLGRVLVPGSVLVSVATLILVTSPPASAATCGATSPSTAPNVGLVGLAPNGIALPKGGTATISATIPLAKGTRKVTFSVLCSPDQGHSAPQSVPTSLHPNSLNPGVQQAYFTIKDRGGTGPEVIEASTHSPLTGKIVHPTVLITWVQPINCSQSPSRLGFVLALECASHSALVSKLIHYARETVDCGIGVGAFLAPAAKLAEIAALFRDSDTAARLGELARGLSAPARTLVKDLYAVRDASGLDKGERIYDFFDDVHSLSGLVQNLRTLLTVLPTDKVGEIGGDIANLVGVGSCLTLIGQIVHYVTGPSSPPPPATPPPTTTPATIVPSVGPTLVDLEDTAANPSNGDQSFGDWSDATGQGVDVDDALPNSLSGYRCAVLDLNQSLADGDTAQLTSFLQAGGTVIALGEHADGDGFDNADAALNDLAQALGVGLSLNDDSNDQGDTVTTNIDSSPLTAGVSSIGYNWASSLAISGSAQELVAGAGDSYSLIGEQSVDGGTFVMSGDSNAFTDNNDGFYTDDDDGILVSNLCP